MKTNNGYDLIGDIHGHYDKAAALLLGLGYRPLNGTFRHPKGRKVIFLGDYIDRGPKICETLHLVRGMVEAGDALAIMGNHEFNAVAFATPDGKGGFLRKHTEGKVKGHAASLAAFKVVRPSGRSGLHGSSTCRSSSILARFALSTRHGTNPTSDCWRVTLSRTISSFVPPTPKVLPSSVRLRSCLKGPELRLPKRASFIDKDGVKRHSIRARWWFMREARTLGDFAMPLPLGAP